VSRFPSNRLVRPALALAAALLALSPARALQHEPMVERFTGVARGTDGRLQYVETHEVRYDGERVLDAVTTYRDPAGEVLAVLRSDYAVDPFAPSYRFEDLRTGRFEAVEVGPDGAVLVAGRRRVPVARPAPGRPPLVAGQGLDRLVRHRLDGLRSGQGLSVAFALPSRHDTYEFRLRALPAPGDDTTIEVRIEAASWILRLLAPSMDCEYDAVTRRLLRYRGPSNLEGEGGQHPVVEITYAYPGTAAEALHAAH
jgi:hypothetical protein